MKRMLVFAVAAVAAAVPAAGGLLGNQSFASSVPVHAATATTHITPRVSGPTTRPTATPTSSPSPTSIAAVKHSDDPAGDDRGGRRRGHGADDTSVSAGSATIVGVSAKSSKHAETGDDHGRHHGSAHEDKDGDGGGKHGGHDDGPHHR